MIILKITFALLSIFSLSTISAQKHYIGIKGEYAWNSLTSKDFHTSTDINITQNFGITYEFQPNKYLSLMTEFTYANRGFSSQLILTDAEGTILSEEKIIYNYGYFALPIKVGAIRYFTRAKHLRLFYTIGIVPSWLNHAEIVYPSSLLFHIETDINTKRINPFNLDLLAEIKLEISKLKKLKIDISYIYQHSILSLTNTDYFTNSSMFLKSSKVTLGLRYPL